MYTPPTFDLITPVYDALSRLVFGNRLKRAAEVWLNLIPVGASVLVLGGGTGALLKPLLAQQPGRVLFLEASGKMVARASRRMVSEGLTGQVQFQLGTERTLRSSDQFDIIILPFVLDLFTRKTLQDQVLPRLLPALKPDGNLLTTDFVRTEKRWQRALLQTMICFFRLTANIEIYQLTDWQRVLESASLIRVRQQSQVWGMVSAEIWQRESKRSNALP